MEQITQAWLALSVRRRLVVAVSSIGMFAAVLLIAKLASTPRLALLYAGLEPVAAGEVVSALETQGVIFEIRGTAIYVAAAQRDALRLTLANEGLPSNGGQGYELLDDLTGFGTTAQMFDAAYWRAKEGELARTIMANRSISAARVHLSNPNTNPFSRGTVTSASVMVTSLGEGVGHQQAVSLRHLVASAVSGLEPNDVAVIDSRTGLFPIGGSELGGRVDSLSRADSLRRNVTRILEARVGTGKAIVEVNVDSFTEREAVTERLVNPDSRIAISSETEEATTRQNDNRGGAVTVASNLPAGDAAGSDRSSESAEVRNRSLVNYEFSETQREVIREPGAIRRVSVAVLVDGEITSNQAGELVWQARDEVELDSLRELVASTVGFDESRGDTITIRSLQFPELPASTEFTGPGFWNSLSLDITALAQVAALSIVSLILGLFVVRPLLGSGTNTAIQHLPAPKEPALENVVAASDFEVGAKSAMLTQDGSRIANEVTSEGHDPAARLRQLIDDRKDETVEVLSRWMSDLPERAK